MLLLRCSLPADSMSRSTSFWPSTIATRSSSAWVALNSMRFISFSPALGHTEEGPILRRGPGGRRTSEIDWVRRHAFGRVRGRVLGFVVAPAGAGLRAGTGIGASSAYVSVNHRWLGLAGERS